MKQIIKYKRFSSSHEFENFQKNTGVNIIHFQPFVSDADQKEPHSGSLTIEVGCFVTYWVRGEDNRVPTQDIREQFENWCEHELVAPKNLTRHDDDTYLNSETTAAWFGWSAAWQRLMQLNGGES